MSRPVDKGPSAGCPVHSPSTREAQGRPYAPLRRGLCRFPKFKATVRPPSDAEHREDEEWFRVTVEAELSAGWGWIDEGRRRNHAGESSPSGEAHACVFFNSRQGKRSGSFSSSQRGPLCAGLASQTERSGSRKSPGLFATRRAMRRLTTHVAASLGNADNFVKSLLRLFEAQETRGLCLSVQRPPPRVAAWEAAQRRFFSSLPSSLPDARATSSLINQSSSLNKTRSDAPADCARLASCLRRFCRRASQEEISLLLLRLLLPQGSAREPAGGESPAAVRGDGESFPSVEEDAEFEEATLSLGDAAVSGAERGGDCLASPDLEAILASADTATRERALAEAVCSLDALKRLRSEMLGEDREPGSLQRAALRLVEEGRFKVACRFVHGLLHDDLHKRGAGERRAAPEVPSFQADEAAGLDFAGETPDFSRTEDASRRAASSEGSSAAVSLFGALQRRALLKAAATRRETPSSACQREREPAASSLGEEQSPFSLSEAVEFLRTQSALGCVQNADLTETLCRWAALSFREIAVRLSEAERVQGLAPSASCSAGLLDEACTRSELFGLSQQQQAVEAFFLETPFLRRRSGFGDWGGGWESPTEKKRLERHVAVECALTLEALSRTLHFDVSLATACCEVLRRLHPWLSLSESCSSLWSLARLGVCDPDLVQRVSWHLQRSRQLAALSPEGLPHVARLLCALRRLRLRSEGLLLSCSEALTRCAKRLVERGRLQDRRLLRSVLFVFHCLSTANASDGPTIAAILPILQAASGEKVGCAGGDDKGAKKAEEQALLGVGVLVLSFNDVVRMGAWVGPFRAAVKRQLLQSLAEDSPSPPTVATLVAACSLCYHLLGFSDAPLLATISKALLKNPDFAAFSQTPSRRTVALAAVLQRSFFAVHLLSPQISTEESPWSSLEEAELLQVMALLKALPFTEATPRRSSTLHEEVFLSLPEELKAHAAAEESAGPFVVDSLLPARQSLATWLQQSRRRLNALPPKQHSPEEAAADGAAALKKKRRTRRPSASKDFSKDAASPTVFAESKATEPDAGVPHLPRHRNDPQSTARGSSKKRSEKLGEVCVDAQTPRKSPSRLQSEVLE